MDRPGLTPRDRSIVTIAALTARNQTVKMAYYFGLALENGVRPGEISEIKSRTSHFILAGGMGRFRIARSTPKPKIEDLLTINYVLPRLLATQVKHFEPWIMHIIQ